MVSPELARGGVFAAGDTLFKLDDQSYRNSVFIARAEVEQHRVEVALAAQNQAIAQKEYELLRQRLGSDAPADTSLAAQLARQQPQYEAAEASLRRAEAQLADAQTQPRTDCSDRTVFRAGAVRVSGHWPIHLTRPSHR